MSDLIPCPECDGELTRSGASGDAVCSRCGVTLYPDGAIKRLGPTLFKQNMIITELIRNPHSRKYLMAKLEDANLAEMTLPIRKDGSLQVGDILEVSVVRTDR